MTTDGSQPHQLAPDRLSSVALAVGVAAEEGDGRDAEHGDHGDEKGVLDERGATLAVAEAGPEPGLDELVGNQHVWLCPFGTCLWVLHGTP